MSGLPREAANGQRCGIAVEYKPEAGQDVTPVRSLKKE
jgi:hypothetical protein